MTVVYLDAFLALNFGVNYLLLACAGRLDGEPRCRWRVALAAGLGAGYAALTLLIPAASFGTGQFRVSEMLTILPVFTPAAIPGLAVGCRYPTCLASCPAPT